MERIWVLKKSMDRSEKTKTCLRCGKCCTEVFFIIDKAYTEDGLDHLEWAKYHGLKITYRRDTNGKRLWGIELSTPCEHLKKEEDGFTTSCAIYENRPQMCRIYSGENEFDECGYR